MVTVKIESVGDDPDSAFMCVYSSNVSQLDGPTAEEIIKAVGDKIRELGFTELSQSRDYIHDHMLRVASLVVSPKAQRLAQDQMNNKLHIGPGPFRGTRNRGVAQR